MKDTNIGKTRDAFGVHSKLWTKLRRSPPICFPKFILPFLKINPPPKTTPRENIAGRGKKIHAWCVPRTTSDCRVTRKGHLRFVLFFSGNKEIPILEQKIVSQEGHQPSSPGVLFPKGMKGNVGGGELARGRTGTPASLHLGRKAAWLTPAAAWVAKNQTGRRGTAQFHRTALCLPPQQPQRSPQE